MRLRVPGSASRRQWTRHLHVRSGKASSLYLRYSRHDIRIRSAPAEIATHALTNLIVAEHDMLGVQIGAHRTGPAGLDLAQHTNGRADLPRCTVTALEGVLFDKRSLQWVQVLITGESLDRDDLGTLMCDGEGEATVHPPAIKQNGTGAALPMVAALLGTGESETLAQ